MGAFPNESSRMPNVGGGGKRPNLPVRHGDHGVARNPQNKSNIGMNDTHATTRAIYWF